MKAYQAGEMPLPVPIDLIPGEIGMGTGQALLQAGGLDALDAATILELQGFFNDLQRGVQYIERIRNLSDAYLYPNLDAGPSAFYDPETQRLKREFAWYPTTLAGLMNAIERVDVQADSALAVLERASEE